MENEDILPDDMDTMLLPEVKTIKTVQFSNAPTQQNNAPVPQNSQQRPYQQPQYQQPQYQQPQQYNAPVNNAPMNNANNAHNAHNANNAHNATSVQKNNGEKKKNGFVKMSNNVSKYPKCYLILIIILILIILIIVIYYRGIMFLGPYCANNVRSSKFKNKEGNKNIISASSSKGDKDKLLMQSLKL
jgi:hypothetical protein